MAEPRDAAAPVRRSAGRYGGRAVGIAVLLTALPPYRLTALPPADPPTLVVAIAVDQMRGDYFQRFAKDFTGGFARLAREGALFTRAYQDHAMTETAPGHSTLLSGRYPRSTGIARNDEGVPDSTMPLVEARGPGASPARFRGTALFDWMKQRWPASRALAVSRKDRSAILMLGRAREAAFWYAGGKFTTSRYYADSLPAWLRAFNQQVTAARGRVTEWSLAMDAARYPEPDSMPYENGGMWFTFPHRFPADSAGRLAAYYDSPYIDSVTLALALEGVQRMDLGRGPAPDLLAIGLSQTDRIGHAFGPDSRELHDQLVHLDRWLGAFLDSLGRLRDARRIVVVVSADHGITPFPEYARSHGQPSAMYVRVDTIIERWRRELVEAYGPGNWIPYFDSGMLAVDRRGLAAAGASVDNIVNRMRADFRRLRGVQAVYTRAQIATSDSSDRDRLRWYRAVPADSPGEIFITLRPGNLFNLPRSTTTHGTPSDQDASVALLFWGEPFRARTIARRASTVDIAPTLAHVLGIEPDPAVEGRVLTEALR